MTHRKWIATIGIGVVSVLTAPLAGAASATPRDATQVLSSSGHRSSEVDVVGFGDTQSESANRGVLVGTLQNVVLPAAASRHATVIVALVTGESLTVPVVAGKANLDVRADAQGNSLLAKKLTHDRIGSLMNGLTSALRRPPAPVSAWFEFTAWAAQQFAQQPAGTHEHLYLLGDQDETTVGCHLDARDLSPANRPALISDCTHGQLPHLPDVEVTQAGAGVGDLPVDTVDGLQGLWQDFWPMTGARLDCWAATLTTDCKAR